MDTTQRRREDLLLRLLYERCAGPLLSSVLPMTGGDRQLAEDIVQETILRAWRNAPRLAGAERTQLRLWLLIMARRIVIEGRRREAARSRELVGCELDERVETDETDRVLSRIAVIDALRSLRAAHREILVEVYLRDRALYEVARSLRLPVGTAKSRMHYALKALRLALEQRGISG